LRNVYGLFLHSAPKPELPTGEKKFPSLRPEEKGETGFLHCEVQTVLLFTSHSI